ncbi:TIR domain-containing protein [Tolypothrix campylonemoides VB511288]|nr:TIR domain-containing protein [Tolypothrix campylonemoides VB511288]
MTYAQPQFDVFLAHNSQDKPLVRAIANQLKQRGLNPWLDEEQIPPGRAFQDEIQQAIPLSKSAAIFLGLQGLGSWQSWELKALISQCVKKNIPVIPVLLPDVRNLPEHLLFLEQFRWVSFSDRIDDENALYLLEWGITGQKPEPTVKVIPQSQSDDISYEPNKEVPITQERRKLEVIETQNTQQNQRDDSGDDLSTETGVNYTQLRDLLKAGQWKEADQETFAVMLKATGTENERYLNTQSIQNFPCTDLRTIDQLWVKYSEGRFGFSVQKRIWSSVGKDYKKFGARVGWRRKGMLRNNFWVYYNELTFSNNDAPQGHLPARISSYYSQILLIFETEEEQGEQWIKIMMKWIIITAEFCGVAVGWRDAEELFSRVQTCKL